jgi:Integrase zinc binding domain/Integrase core domain
MLATVHGSRSLGHWGVVRTAIAMSRRYWWEGRLKDVEEYVKKCLACPMAKLGSSGRRQTRMVRCTPARRFEIAALDNTQINPSGRNGEQKVVVIGDVKSRFIVAVPCKDEHAEMLSTILWERWFAVFGPEQLLTDLGKPLVSAIMRKLCARAGVSKMFSSAYHPQCNGMIEHFNRTMAAEVSKTLLCEDTWPQYVSMNVFRYNCTVLKSTVETPHKSMFGVESFDFDGGLNLRFRQDDEPENLQARLQEVHKRLFDKLLASTTAAGRIYDRAVRETQYEVGDTVFVFHPPGLIDKGRKLVPPWLGPYVVQKKLSDISYLLTDREGKVSRVHVNRLTRTDQDLKETQNPVEGLFPDSRRLLRNVLEYDAIKKQFKTRSAGRRGYKWIDEPNLPDVVVTAYWTIRTANPTTDKPAESNIGSGKSTWLDMTIVTVSIGCVRGNDRWSVSCVTVYWTRLVIAGEGTRNGI